MNAMSLDDPMFAPQALQQAFNLPARAYRDPQLAAREDCRIFAGGWTLAGHLCELDAPQGCLSVELAGIPLIVLRDDTGQLRAFHAVCRHRAGPLQPCGGRGGTLLRCRYHGWTYDSRGRLLAAAEMGSAEDFRTEAVALPEAVVETWQQLVFVSLAPRESLQRWLEGLDQRIGLERLRGYRHAGRRSYVVDCNWKVYVDNYLEGYHVPHVHPTLNAVLDYRDYRISLARWYSLQASPLSGADGVYQDGQALYVWIWPNSMLNLLPGRLQSNRVTPLGIERCRVDFDYYYPEAEDLEARFSADHAFADPIQAEDAEICAAVQRGMASGSWTTGRINPAREDAVHHFHELWREAMRSAA